MPEPRGLALALAEPPSAPRMPEPRGLALAWAGLLAAGCAAPASPGPPTLDAPPRPPPLGLELELSSAPPPLLEQLVAAARRGPVVLRVPPGARRLEAVEVLGVCRPPGGYAYLSAQELGLEGPASGAWVGAPIAPPASSLVGLGCAKATHVVLRLELGARSGSRCLPSRWFLAEGCDRPLHLRLGRLGPPRSLGPPHVSVPGGATRWPVAGGELRVELSPHRLDRTEVSERAYQACVDAGRCAAPARATDDAPETHRGCPEGQATDRPARCVSWADAQAYCRFVGGRLPTEAEWAAAAGAQRFPWGERFPPPPGAGNFADERARDRAPHWRVLQNWVDGYAGPARVDAPGLSRSEAGVVGLAGNVREWVGDRFGPWTAGDRGRDPAGPPRGRRRVVRGASFGESSPEALRSDRRAGYDPGVRSAHIGFRCARTAPASGPPSGG